MIPLAPPRPASGFGVRRGDLLSRMDVNYSRMEPTVSDLLARAKFPMVPLGDFIGDPQLGTSSRSAIEEVGPPVLRIPNVRDGDWSLSELRYSTLASEAEEPLVLQKDDILMVRSNGSKELVGRSAVFKEEGRYIFASFLMRLRVNDPKEYLPEFLARFLNSAAGRPLIDRLSRQALMTNINRTEVRELLVPRPDSHIQSTMVEALSKEWGSWQSDLREVRRLLTESDEEIGDRLKLNYPGPIDPQAWAMRRGGMTEAGRLNAEFFHPERLAAVRAVLACSASARRADAAAEFVKDQVEALSDDDFYIGLANVERDTGELIEGVDDEEEQPTGAVLRFESGDVLFAKLRPYLNKVHLAERSGGVLARVLRLTSRRGCPQRIPGRHTSLSNHPPPDPPHGWRQHSSASNARRCPRNGVAHSGSSSPRRHRRSRWGEPGASPRHQTYGSGQLDRGQSGLW